jgi:hypothetical protein
MLLLLRCWYSAQVPNTDQAADEAITRNINTLCGSLPSLQDRVLILVSDDRGFRTALKTFLQRGGAGVLLVTARQPQQWDTAAWQMSQDERLVFVDWDDVLFEDEPMGSVDWEDVVSQIEQLDEQMGYMPM